MTYFAVSRAVDKAIDKHLVKKDERLTKEEIRQAVLKNREARSCFKSRPEEFNAFFDILFDRRKRRPFTLVHGDEVCPVTALMSLTDADRDCVVYIYAGSPTLGPNELLNNAAMLRKKANENLVKAIRIERFVAKKQSSDRKEAA